MVPTTVEVRDVDAAATEKVRGETTTEITTYAHHLYVIPDEKPHAGEFPVDTSRSSWEAAVLDSELASEGIFRRPLFRSSRPCCRSVRK